MKEEQEEVVYCNCPVGTCQGLELSRCAYQHGMIKPVELARIVLTERKRCVDMVKARIFIDPTNQAQREITAAGLAIWGDIESGTTEPTSEG